MAKATSTTAAPDPLAQEEAELELRTEWLRVQKNFYKAKADAAAGKIKRESKAFQEAKREFSDFRTYWRKIRDALAPEPATTEAEGDER